MHPLFAALANRSWTIELEPTLRAIPTHIAQRYPRLPVTSWEALGQIRQCARPDEASWLLGSSDYEADSEGFQWNECEIMSLATAGSQSERASIVAFWDRHLPFWLTVTADYDYLAIRIDDGSVVHGCAPDWESATVIAADFAVFVRDVFIAAAQKDPGYPLGLFL